MRQKEATRLAERLETLVEEGDVSRARTLLEPVLAEKTPFPVLDRIGELLGGGSLQRVNEFLRVLADDETTGGWVIIGSALGMQLDRDLEGAMSRARGFMIDGDVWYSVDIISERVPGPALLSSFDETLDLLGAWREDENRWIRRCIGVTLHFWAKRSRGATQKLGEAERLLSLVEPMFEEWEIDAVKGVGWGLKTMGKVYPSLMTDWLTRQAVERKRPHRALMLRKALTYLPEKDKARLGKPK